MADIAVRVAAARAVTYWAAGMKDRGERCDLEAGMAKLYASEAAQEVAVTALRVLGREGLLESGAVERHYRDMPLMIIGEGTNEIQRLLIARNLFERYGERLGALTSREGEPDERRQMVLAVRQFVEKDVVPVAQELDAARRYPEALVAGLADLGILGALVPPDLGGLGLDLSTYAMIVEELARGSATLASIVTTHVAAADTITRLGTAAQRERLLPAMTRGERLGGAGGAGAVTAARDGEDWVLTGAISPVANAGRVGLFVIPARVDAMRTAWFAVARETKGLVSDPPVGTLALRGLPHCALRFESARLAASSLLGRGDDDDGAGLRLARLAAAATAVGLAQAAFEAALRYSQQRAAFGKPIGQHQAVQLKLADMATRITAARLSTYAAAGERTPADQERLVAVAKILASETAYEVALESMRVHGGYGYTTEFPVERYYRDAASLLLVPTTNDEERRRLARALVDGPPAREG